MMKKLLIGSASVAGIMGLLATTASAAVTQWNATDTAAVVDPIVTSVHDNIIYLAVTVGPYAVALGIAFLVWRWFQGKAHNPG